MAEQAKVPAIRFAGFTDPWEQRKLGELMDVASVRRVHQEDWTDEGVRFLRARDLVAFAKNESIEDPLFISSEMYKEYSAQSGKVSVGDLLVTGVGTIGVPWLVTSDNPVYFKDGNIIWFKNRHSIDGGFFYHSFTASAIQNCINEAAGIGTVGTYTIETGKKTPIWLPSRQEQREIAAMMTHLDTLITLHQRKYDKLVVFKKSMLEKMFPKDGESVPEIRFAGFTDPWEQRKFVDFVEASGIRNKDNLQLESYSVSNDRGFVPQDEQFENGGTMRDADKTAYWIVEPGSFAYNPARINVGSIGYQSTRKNVIVSSLYEVFKTDRSCDDRFLWHWFKSSLFTKQIEMLQEGGVRLYFFFDKLQKSEIWMPNVDEQRIIGQQFDQLDSLITLHQRKLELLQNIKKSLLDKMFV